MDTETPDFPVAGKIQNAFFKELVFPYCGAQRREVVVGPQYGVDVSVVALPNGQAMAMTSDPLSLIPTLGFRESAWLSVQLMANDMATTGFSPQYAQFTLNLPPSLSPADFEMYWKYIHEFCLRLGIAITGGHTGKFEGQNSTVAGGGTMITIAPADQIITSKGAQPGDVVVMTKECALIATSVLALSFPETVKARCGTAVYEAATRLFYETSAVEAGLVAGSVGKQTGAITAMHDVTEGGVLGAVYELSHASGCGLVIDEDRIPIGTAQQHIGDLFGIDPKYCVGAGSMIITVKPERSSMLIDHLKKEGIDAVVIGRITDPADGRILRRGNTETELSHPGADLYWNAFFHALHNGWK